MGDLRVRVSPGCRLVSGWRSAWAELSGLLGGGVNIACFIRHRLHLSSLAGARRMGLATRSFDELARPFNERRPVLSDAVAATVLPPGEFTADQLADRRHG